MATQEYFYNWLKENFPGQDRAKFEFCAEHLSKHMVGALKEKERKLLEEYDHARNNKQYEYDDRNCGKVTQNVHRRFVNIVTETLPCGCPHAGLVVKDWWCNWSPDSYMDSTWDFQYLSKVWAKNFAANFQTITENNKGIGDLLTNAPRCLKGEACDLLECILHARADKESPMKRGPYHGQPAYLVGSGPSLDWNKKHIDRVKNGVVIAVNGASSMLSHFDIFLSLDWKGADWWWKGQEEKFQDVIGVLCWGANPDLFKLPYKEMRVFGQSGKCWWDDWARDLWPWIVDLDRGFTGTFSAFHLATLMGCNPIVFVGCDSALGDNKEMHLGQNDLPPESAQMMKALDLNNREVYTTGNYMLQNQHLIGGTFWARQHGLRVINASERGMLYTTNGLVEQMKLSDVVDELNGGTNEYPTGTVEAGREVPEQVPQIQACS